MFLLDASGPDSLRLNNIQAFTVDTDGGKRLFVKMNRSNKGLDKYDAEVQGLNSMVSAQCI